MERRRQENSESRRRLEEELVKFQQQKEREKEAALKRIQEEDSKFVQKKAEERVAREKVFQIKESISLRKREIVDELKALRENYRVKNSSPGPLSKSVHLKPLAYDSSKESIYRSRFDIKPSVEESHQLPQSEYGLYVNTTLKPATIFERPKHSVSHSSDLKDANNSTATEEQVKKITAKKEMTVYDRLLSVYLTPRALRNIRSKNEAFHRLIAKRVKAADLINQSADFSRGLPEVVPSRNNM